MHVTVSFTLDIDPGNWPDCAQSLIEDVREHAENVVRDLFFDQGWTVTR